MNQPPVWAPIPNAPAAFVPRADQGLRQWDQDGPVLPVQPLSMRVVTYAVRHGRRRVYMRVRAAT